MQFLCYTLGDDCSGFPPPTPELEAEMEKLIEDGKRAGVMIVTGGLAPSATTTRVTNSGGRVVVTDGPFSEAKEIIGGFAIIDVPTRADAVAWTERFLGIIGEGECRIREIYLA